MGQQDKLHPQYVTDDNGNRTAVILPLAEYEELLDDLEDLAAVAERRDEPTIPHERVARELKQDGILRGDQNQVDLGRDRVRRT